MEKRTAKLRINKNLLFNKSLKLIYKYPKVERIGNMLCESRYYIFFVENTFNNHKCTILRDKFNLTRCLKNENNFRNRF